MNFEVEGSVGIHFKYWQQTANENYATDKFMGQRDKFMWIN